MSGKSAREERREQRLREEASSEGGEQRRKRLLQVGSAAVFLAVVAVAVLIVVSTSDDGGGDASSVEGAAEVREELSGLEQNGLVIGDPTAKVTLIEFGDLQCPVCKSFSEEVIPDVIDSKVRTGVAKLDFRNFTIINEESTPAGAAAIAAGEQGRGWDYVELFYRNQGQEASGYVTDEFLTSIAEGAGVPDIAKWDEARQSKRVIGEVESQTEEARLLGLTGTPSLQIEGPSVEGMESLGTPSSAGELETAIDEAG
jgi:protein-disulfide isomerase